MPGVFVWVSGAGACLRIVKAPAEIPANARIIMPNGKRRRKSGFGLFLGVRIVFILRVLV